MSHSYFQKLVFYRKSNSARQGNGASTNALRLCVGLACTLISIGGAKSLWAQTSLNVIGYAAGGAGFAFSPNTDTALTSLG